MLLPLVLIHWAVQRAPTASFLGSWVPTPGWSCPSFQSGVELHFGHLHHRPCRWFHSLSPAILQLVPQTDPGFVLNHNIINPCDTYIMWILVPEYQISQPSPVAQGITVVIVPCYPRDTADLATYNMALLWADQLQAVALHPRFWCSQTLGII